MVLKDLLMKTLCARILSAQNGALLLGLGLVTLVGSAQANALPTSEASATAEPVVTQSSQQSSDPMAQITSVSQLSDVQPTDWAFQALQSLVDRYGCIQGYPNRTYRGNRALSRYEFAAGLNACMDRVNDLIAQGTADLVKKSDLATLQKLQEEFAAELATLRGRVDALEGRVSTLEAQQFSTTTKLSGAAFFNITAASSSNNVRVEPGAGFATPPNITFSNLVWLTLNTSFTGKDTLVTQLAVGNGTSPYNNYVSGGFFNSTGSPFTDQTAGPTAGAFVLRELSYQFPVFGTARLAIGPRLNFYKYFDGNRFTFPLTGGTSSFNSINSTLLSNAKRGAGAVLQAPLGPSFDLALGYMTEDIEFLPGQRPASNPAVGMFNGNNAATIELTYKASPNFNLRLLYSRTSLQPNGDGTIGGVGVTPSLPGLAGGALFTPSNAQSDVLAANFDWLVSKGFGLFGRYGISSTNINATTGSVGSVTVQTFQVGAAFPDLFKKGALGTLSLVMPFNYTSGRNLMISGPGNNTTQFDLEATYFYPLTDNISIVPAAYVIFNPNNFSGNPTLFVGNLRMQFLF